MTKKSRLTGYIEVDRQSDEEELAMAEDILEVAHCATGDVALTAQQKKAAALLSQGVPISAVAMQVGCTPRAVQKWVKLPQMQSALDYYNNLMLDRIMVTREMLTVQFYEERAKASSAMEGIAALREIGKLNGLYAPEKVETTTDIKSVKQIEALDDDKLIELSEGDVTLIPEPVNYDEEDNAEDAE